MPKKTARKIIDTRTRNSATTISGITLSTPPSVSDHGLLLGLGDDDHLQYLLVSGGRTLTGNLAVADSVTVDGIDISAHAANPAAHHAPVTAGTLIDLTGQQVSLASGAAYQFIGTGADTGPEWHNVSELAGNGLSSDVGVLAVGVSGLGLGVGADAVTLTSASNPGAAASILATDASGLTQLVMLASNVTFASGFAGSGYRVDYGVSEAGKASAEFDNLTVRGRMRVYELLIQQIRATNGSVFVSSASKVKTVASAETNPSWTVNGVELTFNGEAATLTTTIYTLTTADAIEDAGDRSLYHGFLHGDLIRAQQVEWDGSSFAGVIQSNLEVTGVTDLYTYQATLVSGDAAAVGYDYVRLGSVTESSRRGSIYLTSDDSNAPFIDIVDQVAQHEEWNTPGKIKARLGRLSGITDADFGTLAGYGLYSDNVYLKGAIFAKSGQFSGTIYAGSGMIGGWTIGATSLTAGSGASTVGLDSGGTNPAIYAGSATPATAPFRVTKAGALTATNATIEGAITATSGTFTGEIYASAGSINGVLTMGTSGGIYQGTGTFASPYTGLKIWNDSGVGRIAGFNSGAAQWYANTNGYFYSGAGTMRIGADDLRLLLGTYDGDYDDYRFIRWVPSIDGADTAITDFNYRSDMTSWASTGSPNTVNVQISSRVNAAEYSTREARTILAANNWNGTALSRTEIMLRQQHSGDSYNALVRFTMHAWQMPRGTGPTGNPPSGFAYVWLDSASNALKMRDSCGTTRTATFS